MAFTPEQEALLAAGRARAGMPEGAVDEGSGESSFGSDLVRQVGLTARAAGPTAVGAAMGAALGAPAGGIGAIPGAGIGALVMQIVQLADEMGGTRYIDQAMDKLGLPKAATSEERISQAAVKGMAGMAGMAGAARAVLPSVGPTAKSVLTPLTENLGTGAIAAGSGGAAGEIAAQEGVGPTGQFLAATGASAIAPLGVSGVQKVAGGFQRVAGDVEHAVGAAFGHKPSVEKVTADVIQELVKDNPDAIRQAMLDARRYVRGAKPTVAEALAQANLADPTKQIGGAVVKMQSELTGAKGIEDLLPSVAKKQDFAVQQHLERLEARTAPMREEAFRQSRAGGRPDASWPILDVLTLASKPEYRGIPLAQKVLNATEIKLRRDMDTSTGKIDPQILYNIRKDIGNDIVKFSKETQNWDAKTAARIERDVQRSIDTAIENSGALGWKAYLETYHRGMERVRMQASRSAEATRITNIVDPQAPAGMVREELPTIPTLLHRPTMAVNFALRMIAKDATVPVVKELAERMTDPKKFMELMKRPPAAPARKQAHEILLQASTLINLMQMHQADVSGQERSNLEQQ